MRCWRFSIKTGHRRLSWHTSQRTTFLLCASPWSRFVCWSSMESFFPASSDGSAKYVYDLNGLSLWHRARKAHKYTFLNRWWHFLPTLENTSHISTVHRLCSLSVFFSFRLNTFFSAFDVRRRQHRRWLTVVVDSLVDGFLSTLLPLSLVQMSCALD